MSWEVVIFFLHQVGCKLFASREGFAGCAAGAAGLGQPTSSLAGGFGEGRWHRAGHGSGAADPFPCPTSPFCAVLPRHITTKPLVSLAVNPTMAEYALK